MDYKFITGDNLEISSPGWSEGTVLQDIYPDSSFVSGVENPQSMKMVPVTVSYTHLTLPTNREV